MPHSSGTRGLKVIITASVSAEVVTQVQRHCQRRGDFSRIVEEALRMWLNNIKEGSNNINSAINNITETPAPNINNNPPINNIREPTNNNNSSSNNIKSPEPSGELDPRDVWGRAKDCEWLVVTMRGGEWRYWCQKRQEPWSRLARSGQCPCEHYRRRRVERGELEEEWL